MPYTESDDGKVINGKVIVWIRPPGSGDSSKGGPRAGTDAGEGTTGGTVALVGAGGAAAAAGPRGARGGAAAAARRPGPNLAKVLNPKTDQEKALSKAKVEAAAAASLQGAAEKGQPFCEECDALRKEMAVQAT
jgi:hypothetical protein